MHRGSVYDRSNVVCSLRAKISMLDFEIDELAAIDLDEINEDDTDDTEGIRMCMMIIEKQREKAEVLRELNELEPSEDYERRIRNLDEGLMDEIYQILSSKVIPDLR